MNTGAVAARLGPLLVAAMRGRSRADGVAWSADEWEFAETLVAHGANWAAEYAEKGGHNAGIAGGTGAQNGEVNVTQAADLLGINPRSVRMRISRGRLRAELTPGGYRIALADLSDLTEEVA